MDSIGSPNLGPTLLGSHPKSAERDGQVTCVLCQVEACAAGFDLASVVRGVRASGGTARRGSVWMSCFLPGATPSLAAAVLNESHECQISHIRTGEFGNNRTYYLLILVLR